MSLRKKLLDTFGAQVSSDHERYPADVKCLGFLYLYVGRYPRNNASRNTKVTSHSLTALKMCSKCSFIPYKLRFFTHFRLVMKRDPTFAYASFLFP